jgi:hypothetical protein
MVEMIFMFYLNSQFKAENEKKLTVPPSMGSVQAHQVSVQSNLW